MTFALQALISILCFFVGEIFRSLVDRFRSARQVVQERANEQGFISAADSTARCPYREGTPEHAAWYVGRCAGLTARLRGWLPPGCGQAVGTLPNRGNS
jgi:hypothetical protein